MSLSPGPPLHSGESEVVPVREVSHNSGEHEAVADKTPGGVFEPGREIPMKIGVFRYDAEIVIPLCTWYDDAAARKRASCSLTTSSKNRHRKRTV